MKGNANIFLQLGLIHRNAGYFLNNISKNCPNLLFGSLLLIGYSMKSFKNFIIVYILFLKNPELTGLSLIIFLLF